MWAWLPFVATVGFAIAALGITIRAWQVRTAAPRSVSLALSASACVAILVAAADLELPLPELLCQHPIQAGDDDLEAVLAGSLQSEWWRLMPCRRVQVQAETRDLEKPIDFARLAKLATASEVAVDVEFGKTVPLRGDGLELRYDDGETTWPLPITTPIPASRTDDVRPRITGNNAAPTRCRIGGRSFTDLKLHELLRGVSGSAPVGGYYRLSCWLDGQLEETAVSAYVHVSAAEIVLQSRENVTELRLAEPAPGQPFGVEAMTLVPEPPAGTPEQRATAENSVMLILDRPRGPETCIQMRRALERGASVVVAMPEPSFVEACVDLLALAAGGSNNEGRHPMFDREPRLTYVLDEFATGLDRYPSCIFQDCDDAVLTRPPASKPKSSLEVQEDAARDSCRRMTDAALGNAYCEGLPLDLTKSSEAVVRIVNDPRSPDTFRKDRARLDYSTPSNALKPIVEAHEQTSPRIYRENELVVVFTHDSRDLEESDFNAFLETGARLHIARVKDPYGLSLSHVFKNTPATPGQHAPRFLVVDPAKRYEAPLRGCPDPRCVDLSELKLVEPALQSQAAAIPRAHSRFTIDESGVTAPLRFSWWEPAPRPRLRAAKVAQTTLHSGLRERPLALGMVIGRGHLLLLNYSPFERFGALTPWRDAPETHRAVLGGYRLIENLYDKTRDLLAAAGPLQSVLLRPDGAVWITMNDHLAHDEPVREQRRFTAVGTDPIDAPLVDFDESRGQLTYALPAHELNKLTECHAFRPEDSTSGESIHVCPPGPAQRSGRAMNAATSLRMLARYTGGRDVGAAAAGDGVRTRSVGLVALSLILLAAWGRRAARRWSSMRVDRKLRRLEHIAQRRYDPPDAVVAAAGDWDGRSTTWPRTGAFGGYRPLEAGDRPSAIVLQDLVLPAQGGPQLLPRVVQRIEEAAPAILVLVNLGESMRVPGRGEHSKAVFAGHVALHVAASVWKIRGEVAIDAVGIRGDVEIVAPVRLSPGYEELDVQVRARLGQPTLRDRAPWPDELPDCGSVIYVSDFQLEDSRALQAWVTRLEAAGVRVGGVMVYSPLEFTMIEGGRLAGSGVWADRTDWDPDDVFAAFNRRRDLIERIFDVATTGGLVVAATHYTQDDVEVALEGGRLLQILR